MATKKKQSFVMYDEYINFTDELKDEQAGVLLKAILAYANGLELPDMDLEVAFAFKYIKKKMDRDSEAYEEKCKTNSQNRKKREESLTTDNEINERQRTLTTDNESVHDSDSDNDSDYESDSECDYIPAQADTPDSAIEADIIETVINHWNGMGLHEFKHSTPQRKDAIRHLIKQHGLPEVIKTMDKVKANEFLSGRKDGFITTFDWFIDHYGQIADDNYKDFHRDNSAQKSNSKLHFENEHEINFDEFEAAILGN